MTSRSAAPGNSLRSLTRIRPRDDRGDRLLRPVRGASGRFRLLPVSRVPFEGGEELVQESFRRGGLDPPGVVAHGEFHRTGEMVPVHVDDHREVRELEVPGALDRHRVLGGRAAVAAGRVGVEVGVVEDDVEERFPLLPLDVGEGEPLERDQCPLALEDGGRQRRVVRLAHLDGERQGVEEQADHLAAAGNLGTAVADQPGDDACGAPEVGERGAVRGQVEGLEREPEVGGAHPQPGLQLRRDEPVDRCGLGRLRGRGAGLTGHQRGGVAVEQSAPGVLVLLAVCAVAFQCHVRAVAGRRCGSRCRCRVVGRLCGRQFGIAVPDLLDDERDTPAVQDQVVEGQRQVEAVGGPHMHLEADGWPAEVQRAALLRLDPLLDGPVLRATGQPGDVHDLHGRRRACCVRVEHDLERLVVVLQVEVRPQLGVPRHGLPDGVDQLVQVDRAGELVVEDVVIDGRALVEQ
jgi:hypothetical protein